MDSDTEIQLILESKARKEAAAVLGRAEIAPVLGWAEIEKHAGEVLSRAVALRESGGLLLLIYGEGSRQDAALVLLRFAARLSRTTRVRWSRFLDDLSPALKEASGPCFMIIEDAPLFAGLEEVLLQVEPEVVVVAAGDEQSWAGVDLSMLGRSTAVSRYRLVTELATAEDEPLHALTGNADVLSVTICAAVADAVGALLPVDLLARACGVEEDRVVEIIDDPASLLYWDSPHAGPPHHVSLRSSKIAEGFVRSYFGADNPGWLAWYDRILLAADRSDAHHRSALLRLCQGLGARGRYRMLRSLLRKARSLDLWSAGDSREKLVWARVCGSASLFDHAVDLLESALVAEPDNEFLLQARANALSKWAVRDARRIGEARSAYEGLVQRLRENAVARHAWAVFEAEVGRDAARVAEELRVLEDMGQRAPKRYPRTLEMARVARAHLELREAHFDEALRLLEEPVGRGNLYARHLRAVVRAALGEYAKAQSDLGEILQEIPGHLQTLHFWAKIAFDRGHLDDAENTLRQGIEISPDHPYLLHLLSQVLEEREKYGEAEQLLVRVVEDPLNVQGQVALAVLRSKTGRMTEAETLFATIVQRNPNHAWAYVAWADALMRQTSESGRGAPGLSERVDDLLSAAKRVGGSPVATAVSDARLRVLRGQLQSARAIIGAVARQAAAPVVDKIIALNTWAGFEARAAVNDEARNLYEESLALDPENAFTLRAFGTFLVGQGGDPDRGRVLLRRAADLGLNSTTVP